MEKRQFNLSFTYRIKKKMKEIKNAQKSNEEEGGGF
jgi:hypothetical protein